MEHNHSQQHSTEVKPPQKTFAQRLKEYKPLIFVLAGILAADALLYTQLELSGWMQAMRLFMGLFFLTFGAFKLLDLKGFAMAYAEYDILAKQSSVYAKIYPFIELALGLLYLTNTAPLWTNAATLAVMIIGSIGVINVVWIKKQQIHCACLGAVVKLPMTTVTVIEDVGMGLMALFMLITLLV